MEVAALLVGSVAAALLIHFLSSRRAKRLRVDKKLRIADIQTITAADLAAAGGAQRRQPKTESEAEAEKLARLLVSEIGLYNEEFIDEGKRNRDLYFRLCEDIERSRSMYLERIDDSVEDDYFLQKLVDLIAEGDASLFGLENQPKEG